MKAHRYQKRLYRSWVLPEGLCKTHIAVYETDLQILSDRPVDRDMVRERILFYRRQIEGYIQKDKRFLVSLKPVAVELGAAYIVRAMADAARKANVGPMAAVAGAIAECIGADLLKRKYQEVIIENGGDIFLRIRRPRAIGIFAGGSKLSGRLNILMRPVRGCRGVCASSGTVGHSLSFGEADSVVIVARTAVLADAVATATANLVHTKDDFSKAIQFARSIKQVYGALIIMKNNLATWGEVELS